MIVAKLISPLPHVLTWSGLTIRKTQAKFFHYLHCNFSVLSVSILAVLTQNQQTDFPGGNDSGDQYLKMSVKELKQQDIEDYIFYKSSEKFYTYFHTI